MLTSPADSDYVDEAIEFPQASRRRLGMDEKRWVAFTSVIAAIALTVVKLVVGLMTNSLGILSEALHSALDLVAAGMTFYAVSASAKPPDEEHTYGHGRIENFSAFVETILLLITVLWVFYEAIRRIFFWELEVETNILAFGVLIFAIIIDFSRSRALSKAAKKYDSQALEADALHFSSDILSSSVVFIGLICTHFGFPLGDPLGAIGVAIIVLVMTVKLGRETINHLLDRAPKGFRESICTAVENLEGVMSCGRIRVRKAGAITFVDIEIHIDPSLPVERAQKIGERVKTAIVEVVGSADVTVSVQAGYKAYPYLVNSIRYDADKFERIRSIHNIHAFEFGDYAWVVLDISVSEEETLQEAHRIASDFEEHLLNKYASIKEVITHIEPASDTPSESIDMGKAKRIILSLFREIELLDNCHDIQFFSLGSGTFNVTMHCTADPNLPIKKVHQATVLLEHRIRERLPGVHHITIHVEPENGDSSSPAEK